MLHFKKLSVEYYCHSVRGKRKHILYCTWWVLLNNWFQLFAIFRGKETKTDFLDSCSHPSMKTVLLWLGTLAINSIQKETLQQCFIFHIPIDENPMLEDIHHLHRERPSEPSTPVDLQYVNHLVLNPRIFWTVLTVFDLIIIMSTWIVVFVILISFYILAKTV